MKDIIDSLDLDLNRKVIFLVDTLTVSNKRARKIVRLLTAPCMMKDPERSPAPRLIILMLRTLAEARLFTNNW